MRSWCVWMLVAIAALSMTGVAEAKKKARAPRILPNCDKDEPGAPGDEDTFHDFLEDGLIFDLGAPPAYEDTWADPPEDLPVSVTVFNGTDQPTHAIVEATICAIEEDCISLGASAADWSPTMELLPGERRTMVLWTGEPLSYGTHTISFTLMNGDGDFADYHFGERIVVGQSKVEMTEILVDGQAMAKRKSNEVRMEDPERGVLMTVKVKNEGIAPEGVYAIFAIRLDRDCIDEIYAPSRALNEAREQDSRVEPVFVPPGSDNIEVTALWERTNKVGRHSVSVLLFDQTGQLLAEERGLRLRVR